jgi:hypothetical protein
LRYVGYGLLGAIVVAWAWRAIHDTTSYDTGAAWIAGDVAWRTGHPEMLGFWTGLPSLAGAMALVSRVVSIKAAGELVTALNLVLFGGAAWLVLQRLRPRLTPRWWWIAAFGLVTFIPLISTVWWKQFNLISLVLAAAGFELLRRGRSRSAAAAIGISVAIKPMVILLPFMMLARRRTRAAGVLALVWIVALNLAAQALMAARAGQLGPLDPLSALHNLLNKTHPNQFLCHPLNFSPGSLLCRAVGGFQYWTLQRVIVWCALLLLAAWVFTSLRGRSLLSWDAFAFICSLSAMTSPFEWTHYQVMLAPLFLVLVFRFSREGAGLGPWLGLAVALVLTTLIWQPYGTLYGTLHQLFTGHHQDYSSLSSAPQVTFQEGLAGFAQYILVLTGALWYSGRQSFGRGIAAGSPAPSVAMGSGPD